jgi:N-acetylglutamate synthase
MDVGRLCRLADENLIAAFDLVRRCLHDSRGATRRFGSVAAIRTGIEVGFYNPVLALGSDASIDDVLAAVDWVESSGLPTTVHLSGGVERRIGADLLARDFAVDPWASPVMVLEPIRPSRLAAPELRLRVGGAELIDDWHTAVGMSATLRRVIGPEFMADPTVRVAVADLEGQPVAHAAAVRSGPAIGIYAVGTVEGYRRRGYGRAVTWAVIDAGVAAWGSEVVLLQSSEAGVPVYESMGFAEVDRIFAFDRASVSARPA